MSKMVKVEATVADLEKLCWLAAREYVMFSTWNPNDEGYDNGFYAYIKCNDSFAYATADAEAIDVRDIPLLIEVAEKYQWDGIVAYVSTRRNIDPIPSLITTKFIQAREEIKACDTLS